MTDEVREMRNAAIVVLVLLAAMLLSLVFVPCAKADFVLEFSSEQCFACEKMKPIVADLRHSGVDIRTVKVEKRPDLKNFYRINRWPTYAYVIERDGKQYDSGFRLKYPCTAGQLRRFSVAPGVTSAGSTARKLLEQ